MLPILVRVRPFAEQAASACDSVPWPGAPALPSLTFLLLDSLPPAQAGLAGGLFNAGRQTGGALAVATFGTLVAGSFLTGMRVSMLISAVLLLLSTAAAFAVFRGRA